MPDRLGDLELLAQRQLVACALVPGLVVDAAAGLEIEDGVVAVNDAPAVGGTGVEVGARHHAALQVGCAHPRGTEPLAQRAERVLDAAAQLRGHRRGVDEPAVLHLDRQLMHDLADIAGAVALLRVRLARFSAQRRKGFRAAAAIGLPMVLDVLDGTVGGPLDEQRLGQPADDGGDAGQVLAVPVVAVAAGLEGEGLAVEEGIAHAATPSSSRAFKRSFSSVMAARQPSGQVAILVCSVFHSVPSALMVLQVRSNASMR